MRQTQLSSRQIQMTVLVVVILFGGFMAYVFTVLPSNADPVGSRRFAIVCTVVATLAAVWLAKLIGDVACRIRVGGGITSPPNFLGPPRRTYILRRQPSDAAAPRARYNTIMTVEQLKNVIHAKPFSPFTIHMGDGRAFFVKHPDFISHSPSGRTVIVYGDDDNFSILDLLLATELEIHPPAKPGAAA